MWTDTGYATSVGYGAEGQMTIADGGRFSSTGSLFVGSWTGKGTLTVTGANSTVSGNNLYVGSSSEGSVVIGDGGSVSTANTTVGENSTGALTVADGGSFSASQLALGSVQGSSGVLNIGAPAGSTPTAAGSVSIGYVSSGDGSAVINFNHTDTALAFSTELNAKTTLVKNGPGTTIVTATGYSDYFYYGPLVVNAGTLRLNSSLRYSNATVNAGGTFGGSGTVGRLTINAGGTLAPGNSPGTLTAGNTTFSPGGLYEWQINDATGTAGTNWDLLSISGTLDLSALADADGSRFTLSLVSLTAENSPGLLANFNPAQSYTFTVARATSGLLGFTPGSFALNTASFQNSATGSWSIGVGNGGHDLTVSYTAPAIPEPSTCAALAGLAALALALLRRRSRM